MARNPIVFQNGNLVSNAKVEVGGTVYDVEPAVYEGTTPLSASNLNQMQTNIYDYVDEEITEASQTGKTITLNNEWRPAFKASGDSLTTIIPINNPSRVAPTLNITGEVYTGSSWSNISISNTFSYNETELILRFGTNVSITNGNVYLIRLTGTITVE